MSDALPDRSPLPSGVAPPDAERIAALPLEERPAALSEAVRRLESALEATESPPLPR
ncbi:MAG TPA: hypothetical protein VFW71_03045 [Actinomycetota bacterium]|nr:hypothetical protein [Actinomycetota bacterium]